VEQDGKPYCDDDFNNLFGPKCATCLKPIVDKCISAVGNTYHPECFFCEGCGIGLRGKPYKAFEGAPYCMPCGVGHGPPVIEGICAKCKKPIVGDFITFQGLKVHAEHYRCEESGCELKAGNCHEYEGKIYSTSEYLKLMARICALCTKSIVGFSVTGGGKIWHPEHFVCFTCKEPFANSNFSEHLGKPYCELHYLQQFGNICHTCNKPIADSAFTEEVFNFESKPLCKSCYGDLPKEVRERWKRRRIEM